MQIYPGIGAKGLEKFLDEFRIKISDLPRMEGDMIYQCRPAANVYRY